jgi:hypothetical protein
MPPSSSSPASAHDPSAPAEVFSTSGALFARPVRGRAELLRRSRNLFALGVGGIAAGIGYYTYSAKVADPIHLYLGQAMIVLAVLPSLLWAKRAHYGLPLFEVFMLTGLNTYAIPLLSGHQALKRFEPETITAAAFGVVLFQLVANLAFVSVRARPKRGAFWQVEIFSRNLSRYLTYAMALTTVYTAVILMTNWIPSELEGLLRSICYGVGIIATFLQCRRWGQNQLRPGEKIPFCVLLVAQVIFSWAALFLVGGISILLLGLLGYVSSSKKIPLVMLALVLPVIAILHNGKSAMRLKYWENGAPMPSSLTELPAFFSEWINDGLDPEIKAKSEESNHLLERTSLFHIMCLVVSITPEHKPYLDGETYAQIPAQFVPRPLWPDKPLGHISTYTLAIYYGLQRAEDTVKTTIGFGLLTEAYANFGFFGLGILGALVGGFFKLVSTWASESPILSLGGMLMVILMAWSFQTEFTLSLWLSSFTSACLTVLGVPFVLRKFIK